MPTIRRNLMIPAMLSCAMLALSAPPAMPYPDAGNRRHPEHRRRRKLKGYQKNRKR